MTELTFNKRIGKNIRKYRTQETNLRQEDLAKRIGVSRSTIAALESNNINKGVSTYLLYKISKVLNKEIDDFFI